jgi:hypothetical protein
VGFVEDKAALGRFSPSTSVSPANHSTNFSIIIITHGWHNRPVSGHSAEWTQMDSTPHYTNLIKKFIKKMLSQNHELKRLIVRHSLGRWIKLELNL